MYELCRAFFRDSLDEGRDPSQLYFGSHNIEIFRAEEVSLLCVALP